MSNSLTPTAVTIEGATLVIRTENAAEPIRVGPGVSVLCNGILMTPSTNAAAWFDTLMALREQHVAAGRLHAVPVPKLTAITDGDGDVTGVRFDQ